MFYLEKSDQKIIISIGHGILSVSDISKHTDLTFAQTAKRIIVLTRQDMLATEKKGRVRNVWLTAAGSKIFETLKYCLGKER